MSRSLYVYLKHIRR